MTHTRTLPPCTRERCQESRDSLEAQIKTHQLKILNSIFWPNLSSISVTILTILAKEILILGLNKIVFFITEF